MQPVGVGRRAAAILIDSVLMFIVAYAIAAMSGQTTSDGFRIEGGPFFIWLAIYLAYYIAMELWMGATLGKLALNLKVVKQDGQALDLQASIVRNLLRLVDGLFFYLVGAIVAWISKSRQRLGDMAAHTIVVKARAWVPVLLACGMAAALPVDEAHAGSPRYADVVVSDEKGGPAKKVFRPDTAKIYVRMRLVDVPAGAKVKSAWVAEKTKVAPPNYAIDSHEMKVGAGAQIATFSMGRPHAGWAEGDYRVDLFIDQKLAQKVKFRVKP